MTEVVQKPWCYIEDGIVIYRTYSIYNCVRSMVACRLGESMFPPHASFRAAMDASAGLEEPLLARAADHLGGDLLWQQKDFTLELGHMQGNPIIVRCRIDAMHQQSDTIVEAKAFGDALWEKYIDGGLDALGVLGTKYKWQAAVQGHATERKVRFAVGHKVKKDDGTFYIKEVRVSEALPAEEYVPLDVIRERIAFIEECAAADELPDCDMRCRESDPFGEVHIFASAVKGDEELETLLLRYDELDDQIKDLSDEKGELRDALIENYGFEKFTAGACSMNIIRVKSSRFDTKWLKKNMPDVYDQGVVPTESIRVDVDGPRKRARKSNKEDKRDGIRGEGDA